MAAEVVETADVLQGQADSLQDQVANFVLQLRSVNSSAQQGGTNGGDSGSVETRHVRPLSVARSA